MPLIKCADCGKEFSDSAAACPNCGRPNKAAPAKKSIGCAGIGCLTIIVATIIGGIVSQSSSVSESSSPPAHTVEYQIVEQWSIPNGGFGKVVVIADTAANEKSLRALGEEFKYDTRNDRNAFISVFSDPRAPAMRRAVLADQASKKDLAFYDKHFVATYSRNINTGFHQMSMTPKGLHGPQLDVSY